MSEEKEPEITTVVLGRVELDPAEAEAYKEKIKKAKAGGSVASLKGSTPLGHIPKLQNTPMLQKQGDSTFNPLTADGGVQPRPPGSPVIRPETAEALKQMQEAQNKAVDAEKEIKKELETSKDDLFDMFDFDGKTEMDRILNNKKRRAEIEGRCLPMKIEDLIMKDEVQQDITIVPDKFVIRLRSATPVENLFVKRLISEEKITSNEYLLEKYGICQLALSLVSINGSLLPSHLDENGVPSDKLFEIKLKMLLKKSAYVVADLGINFYWFDLRVRRLLNPEDLKNG